MEKCILNCTKSASDEIVTLKQIKIGKLIAVSHKRNDGKHKLFNGIELLTVHDACFKSYMHESNINLAKKRKFEDLSEVELLSTKPVSGIKAEFDYVKLCVICGDEAETIYEEKFQKIRPCILGNFFILFLVKF